MTDRLAIPPVVPDGDQTQETLGLLQQRLLAAEEDTKDLTNQLAEMGFHGESKQEGISPITPYKAPVADSQILHQRYEVLVSRVCKMESAIQTLKLNLLRAQAERDLSKEEKMTANEKLSSTSDAYEKELAKANRELVQCRKDLKEAIEERRRGQDDSRRLQETLDVATSSESEALALVEDLKSAKMKLTRRVNDLREEVARESSLRASLEESHNTLLTRIQEVEAIVEHEQDEVKNLNTICSQLKRESVRAKEEAELERSLRLQAEDSLTKITSQSGDMHSQMSTLQEDKAYLMGEMNKLRTRYNELIQQLDQTHKLVNDKQSTHEQLEKENKRLYEAMKSTASQNAQLIAKYEEEIESLKTEVASKMQMEEKIKHLSDQLRVESREKGHAVTTSSQLTAKSQDLEEKVRLHEQDMGEMRDKHQREMAELREALRNNESEKERIMKDKDSLLDEVNQAVDGMVEERNHLQSQLQQSKIDLESSAQTHKQLEQENRRLLERLGALEEQANASAQIETTMAEMMEQKNKLAYDKGRLQNRVGELQREVESLASGQSELAQLRKLASTTESNYKKSQTELNNARMMIQRLESRVKQLEVSGERKEEDFRLAIQARDEAVKEAQRLLSHIDDIEDRQRHKVGGLERSLGDTRQDNKKVAATLESIMKSHTQLQFTVEGLQMELGKKDAIINQHSCEKSEFQHRNRQLQKELDNLQSKLVSMETLEANEIGPLRNVIEQCKSDNTKMAASLETVVKSNGKLQTSMEALKDELEKKNFVLEQLQDVRDREGEAHNQQIQTYEERLENMKEQLSREREKALRKGNKEVLEVRKQLEDLVSKNGELSRANSDLRHRITDLEYEAREHKEKTASYRSQVEHLSKVRQKQDDSLKSLQVVSDQLEVLERSNKDYAKKNEHQAKMISKFMSQMTNLQEELQGLAQSQTETASLLQQQEDQLRRERARNDDLKRKYKESRRRESELEELRRQTEEKLREANNESLQISTNLTDAHSWFKSKFDTLQRELKKSRLEREGDHNALLVETLQDEIDAYRKNQAGLIHENYEQKQLLEDEQRKAQETAEKARQMIKASRETIGRLADYAEVAQRETNTQMRGVYEQLKSEKDYARQTEAKYKGLKVSSLRHTEQLARELELLRSQSYLPYDSFNSSGS